MYCSITLAMMHVLYLQNMLLLSMLHLLFSCCQMKCNEQSSSLPVKMTANISQQRCITDGYFSLEHFKLYELVISFILFQFILIFFYIPVHVVFSIYLNIFSRNISICYC